MRTYPSCGATIILLVICVQVVHSFWNDHSSSSSSNKKKGHNHNDQGSCMVSCYCNNDRESVCLKSLPGVQSSSQHQKPHHNSGRGKASGVAAAGAVAAGAAAAVGMAGAVAANNNNRHKQPQNAPPPPRPPPPPTPQQRPPPPTPQQRPPPPQPKTNTQPKPDPSECNWCIRASCNPGACREARNFYPAQDAERLMNAMKGLGTNEDVLLDILIYRSDRQIELIKQAYLGYGKTLDKDIADDTSSKIKELFEALLKSRARFFADELEEALKKKNEHDIIMIVTSLSPCAMRQISSAYSNKHNGKSIIDEAENAAILMFEEFLKEVIKANRDPEGPVDDQKVTEDADRLYQGGYNSYIKDKRAFIDVFTHRSFAHIRKVKEKYNQKYSRDGTFEEAVANHSGGGKVTEGLLSILHNIEDQPRYFAQEIKEATATFTGFGIGNNSKLIRILRGRCGVDLGDIREAYPRVNDGKQLVDVLKGKSYMDYEDALVKMVTQQTV